MKGLIFTYVLAYGGSLVALFNPFAGLLIYICFSILKPQMVWPWSVPPGHYSRIIGVAMIVGWLFHGFGRWNFGRGRVLLILFFLYWLWMIIATLFSVNSIVSWPYVETTFKILLPFVVGLTVLHSWVQIKQVLWVIIGSIGFVALEFNLSYFSGYNRAALDGFGSLDNNGLAVIMVIGFGLTFFIVNGIFPWWEKALALIINLLSLHTILFSYSRGGMMALIFTASFGFFLIPKKPKHYFIFAILLLIGIRLAGPAVSERFMSSFASAENRDASAQSRLDLWIDCVDVMWHNPIVGIGPANWALIASDYGWEDRKAAHTTWLQVGAELGLPGLLLIGCFYGICFKRMWPIARGQIGEHEPFHQAVAQMVIGSLVGFIVSSQFVSLINLEVPYYLVLLAAVALKLAPVNSSNDGKSQISVNGGIILRSLSKESKQSYGKI